MTKNSKQMSREELEQSFEKVIARKEAERQRSAMRRQKMREMGIRSYTFWGPASKGLTPVMFYVEPNVAEYIKKQVANGKIARLVHSGDHQGKQMFALVTTDSGNAQNEQVSPNTNAQQPHQAQ